jgi:hypothetical protein
VPALQQCEEQLHQIYGEANRGAGSLAGFQDNFMGRVLRHSRPAHALALVAMVGPTIKACAADNPPPGSGSQTIHSCSPNYTDENKLGRLSIQQKGPGTSIQWGVYPNLPADRYRLTIWIGGNVFDGKNQNYPPHGSVPPDVQDPKTDHRVRTYKPGQIFKITGTSYIAEGAVVQKFFIKCRLV